MNVFDSLVQEVEDGMRGRNAGIPMGFTRLNSHVSIRKSNNYLIGGYTGCLSGDTIIEVARKQMTANTERYSIKEAYEKLHGIDLRPWDPRLPTRVKVFMPDKGQTSVHWIEDIVSSGIKRVFRVRTTTGKEIETTLDHKFMITEEGEFKRLSELKVGDKIICKSPKESRAHGRV